jgi:SAM-dependent methyltransferase
MMPFTRKAIEKASDMLSGILRRSPSSTDDPELVERCRTRWRGVPPDGHLTWGKTVSGESFVRKIQEYGGFGREKSILELGPGYGRLLRACLDRDVPFRDYVGVDISPLTLEHLRTGFSGPNISFVQGDIEKVSFNRSFDLFFSSLTLKHLFPTFEMALWNVSKALRPGALVIFDLIEGKGSNWEGDNTYVRCYKKREVRKILRRAKLKFVAFDTVAHDPEHVRLLVVARKD